MSQLVDNRFEILEEIGRGADSVVFSARDRVTDSLVALKIVPAEGWAREEVQAEISARSRCPSPYVVPIVAWGVTDMPSGTCLYIATQLLDGMTLERHIRERRERGEKCTSEKEATEIAEKIATALHSIHQAGLFHGDLKPANVFLTSDGEVRLLDLGFASGVEQGPTSAGTACYAAPERLLGQASDGRADLYSLGCIMYELLTGRPPFHSDDIAAVLFDQVNTAPPPPARYRPDLSPLTNEIVLCLLEKSPENRFQSAMECAQVLAAGQDSPWWQEISGRFQQEDPTTARERARSPARRWHTPFVGRGAELRHLKDRISAGLDNNEGCFIVVSGVAGVGKTRLIDEALAAFTGKALILTSRCIKFETRIPYLSLVGLLEDLRANQGLDSLRFQRFLTRHLPNTPMLVPKFMDFLAKQVPSESDQKVLNADSLLYLLTSLFHHIATECPLILFIDDLHWAEPSTCNFLRYFVRNISDVPLVVVAGYRADEPSGSGEHEMPSGSLLRDLALERNFETVNLGLLSAREAQELVEKTCGASVSKELAPLLYRETEGNPYYLFEAISLLRSQEVIVGEGVSSRVASSVTDISIPSTVADLFRSRLASLSDADRELLEFASIQGPVFRSDLLGEPAKSDRLSILRRLAKIEREHRLIRAREDGYAFDHHLLYEYVYQSIAPELREAFHVQVAERIEASIIGEPTEDAVYKMAEHYSKGGCDLKAIEYLLQASRLSMRRYSGAEARDALDRAMAHYGRLAAPLRSPEREWEIALLRAQISAHLGDFEEERKAVEDLRRLADFFRSPVRTLEAAELAAELAVRTSRLDDALERFRSALGVAERLGDEKRVAKLTRCIGTTYREMKDWDQAMQYLSEALRLARAQNDHHLMACVIKDIATVKTMQTWWREAIEDYLEALPLLRQTGDRREEALALNGLAVSLFCAGKQDEALQRWEEAGRIFESIGYPAGQSNILHNLGVTYLNMGQIDKAVECLSSALRLRQATGMRHAQVLTLTWLGFVHVLVGAYDKGAELLRSALTLAREIGAELACIEIYYHFVELALAKGDVDAASEHLRNGWKVFETNQDPYQRAPLLVAETMINLARGDFEEASGSLEKARQAKAACEQPAHDLAIYGAWAAQGLGKADEAERFIDEYLEFMRDCPFIYRRIEGALALITVASLQGDTERKSHAFELLRSELRKLEEGTQDPELKAALLSRWGTYLQRG